MSLSALDPLHPLSALENRAPAVTGGPTHTANQDDAFQTALRADAAKPAPSRASSSTDHVAPKTLHPHAAQRGRHAAPIHSPPESSPVTSNDTAAASAATAQTEKTRHQGADAAADSTIKDSGAPKLADAAADPAQGAVPQPLDMPVQTITCNDPAPAPSVENPVNVAPAPPMPPAPSDKSPIASIPPPAGASGAPAAAGAPVGVVEVPVAGASAPATPAPAGNPPLVSLSVAAAAPAVEKPLTLQQAAPQPVVAADQTAPAAPSVAAKTLPASAVAAAIQPAASSKGNKAVDVQGNQAGDQTAATAGKAGSSALDPTSVAAIADSSPQGKSGQEKHSDKSPPDAATFLATAAPAPASGTDPLLDPASKAVSPPATTPLVPTADASQRPTEPTNPSAPTTGPAPPYPMRLPPQLLGRAAPGQSRSGATVTVDATKFLQRVAKAFESAQQRGGEVRLRLSPPELGALRLEVSVKDGVLVARVETETKAAQTALLDNLPVLRERLAEQGIRVERFDINLNQGQDNGNSDRPADTRAWEQNSAPRRTVAAAPLAESAAAAATVSAGALAAGRLNIIV